MKSSKMARKLPKYRYVHFFMTLHQIIFRNTDFQNQVKFHTAIKNQIPLKPMVVKSEQIQSMIKMTKLKPPMMIIPILAKKRIQKKKEVIIFKLTFMVPVLFITVP